MRATKHILKMKIILLHLLVFLFQLTTFCQTMEEWKEQARENIFKKNYAAAIDNYSRILLRNPTEASTYFDRALVKDMLEDYAGAIRDYSAAIELDSTNSDNFYLRGVAKCKIKKYEEGRSDFILALRLEPENADVHYYKGLANSALHHYIEAISDYEHARTYNTDKTSESFGNSAWANFKMHKFFLAFKDCKSARKHKPSDDPKKYPIFCSCYFHKKSNF